MLQTVGRYPPVQLDELARLEHISLMKESRAGAYSSTYHPDWSILAARIVVSDLHKQTESSFSKLADKLHGYKHPITGANASLIAEDVAEIIANNAERLDKAINYERDFECVQQTHIQSLSLFGAAAGTGDS